MLQERGGYFFTAALVDPRTAQKLPQSAVNLLILPQIALLNNVTAHMVCT